MSEWTLVTWEHPCETSIWFTEEPKDDVPEQRWVPCEGNISGCAKWDVYWEVPANPPMVLLSLHATARGPELGVITRWGGFERRSIVYDSNAIRRYAWRSIEGCSNFGPLLSDAGTWVGAQQGFLPSRYVFYRTGAEDSPEPVGMSNNSQRWAASNELLVVQPVGAQTLAIWDHQAEQTYIKNAPPGVANSIGVPLGDDVVLFRHSPTAPEPKGWIWKRATGQFEPLIEPPGKAVVDLRGDLSRLVWIETEPPGPGDSWPPGDLYVSPFATSSTGVVPAHVRNVPSFVNNSAMGDGYYAMSSHEPDRRIHIYRLSDGRHWSFEIPVDAVVLRDGIFVASGSVFYNTLTSIFRQEIAALGPGD